MHRRYCIVWLISPLLVILISSVVTLLLLLPVAIGVALLPASLRGLAPSAKPR
jgi:hypothetical protein